MQNKITLAIDALASAAFVEGGVSPENTQAARDLTEQRKRELVEAIAAPQCLLQIQEPAVNQQLTTEQEPVAWLVKRSQSVKLPGEKYAEDCEWLEEADEPGQEGSFPVYAAPVLAAQPATNHSETPNSSTITVPRGWKLVPDDATPEWIANLESSPVWSEAVGECIKKFLAAAPSAPQAAPAAVAVPKCPFPCGWENLHKLAVAEGAFLANSLREDEPLTEHQRDTVMRVVNYSIEMARAALAATPAAAANDADGEAFRTAASLGLTLRFHGNCAQSGMPGAASAYEVVPGPDSAVAMREAIERAAAVIANGGEAQKSAPAADAPITLMTEDQARDWAWNKVREDVGTEGWTVMDSVNYHGFYMWGWNYRSQYELQRTATRSAVMQEILSAAPEAAAPDSESVLIDGVAYDLPAAVAAELLRLHIELLQPATPAATAPVAHTHHCTARSADGSCEECEVHAQDMAEQKAEQQAAAPVVLPEPDAYVNPSDLSMLARKEPAPKNKAWMFYTPHPELIGVYSVHTLRALLATGGQAQAVAEDERAAWFALAMNSAAYIEDAAACLRDGDAKRSAAGAAKHVREKCNALWGAAPQQADARDAESDYQRGYRHGYNRRDAEVKGALL